MRREREGMAAEVAREKAAAAVAANAKGAEEMEGVVMAVTPQGEEKDEIED